MLPTLRMRPFPLPAGLLGAGILAAGLAAPAHAQSTLPPPNIEDDFAYPTVRFSLSLGSGARALLAEVFAR